MFRNSARRLCALVILAAVAGSVFAAEPVESKSLAARLNPFSGSSKPSLSPAPASPVPAKPSPNTQISGPLSPETLNEALREEQAAYTRRLAVCLQLRKVAYEKNDDALAAQADELERLAEITYKSRFARFGGKSNLRTNQGADDLDRTLGSTMTATPGSMGVRSPADARPTVAQLKNFREVKP